MATQVLSEARDALSAKRVYGEPFEKNGATVIPAASVRGGAGRGESPEGKGQGGGFGMSAHPTGAWIIKGESVRWKPAVDVTRIAIIGELVGLAGVFAWRSVAVARATSRPLVPRSVRRLALALALNRSRRRFAFPRRPRRTPAVTFTQDVPFVHVRR
ncbi:MAG: hypothetical protein ACM33B_15290 [Pseudomonadota bacterium]